MMRRIAAGPPVSGLLTVLVCRLRLGCRLSILKGVIVRKRVLIVANGFVNDASHALPGELREFAPPDSDMHVVVPTLLGRLQSLCSDIDAPRADAQARLDRILDDMTALGLSATGSTADEDQLQAIEDALAEFHAHAIVLITRVPDQQNRRERELTAKAARFGLPVGGALITRNGTVAAPSPSDRSPTSIPNAESPQNSWRCPTRQPTVPSTSHR
jgi:hypothetical protein